jgi:hypothetical protein
MALMFSSVISTLKSNTRPDKQQIAVIIEQARSKWPYDIVLTYRDDITNDEMQIVASLSASGGFLLKHYIRNSGTETHAFSLGNAESLNTYTRHDDDMFVIQGLIIPAETVAQSLLDFISSNGEKSESISWIDEEALPKGMYWGISENVM